MDKVTMKDLIDALKNSKRTICIIGPLAEQKRVSYSEEEWQRLTHKSLVKHTEDFYELFNRHFDVAIENQESKALTYLKELQEMELIHQFYVQHITSLYKEFSPIYLKGNDLLECRSCNTIYTKEEANEKNYHCDKNHLIRPKAILPNDKYNLDVLKSYDEDLSMADVVFLIGFDFNEEALLDTVYSVSNMKYRINQATKERFRTMTVVVGDLGSKEDAQLLYDEYHFDFIVNEHPDTAMKRFNEIVKNTLNKA